MTDYVANRTIWHSGQNKYFYKGDIVSLAHLKKGEITRLVEAGVVSKVHKPADTNKEIRDDSDK